MEPTITAAVNITSEKKLSVIKKYPLETLIALLIGAVSFLTWWQFDTAKKVEQVQSELKNYLYKDRQELINSIEKNTQSVDKNTDIMIDVKYYLQNRQNR